MTTALVQGGVEKPDKLKPNRCEGPARTKGKIAAKDNVLGIAKTVEGTGTPHKNICAPGLALVLFADLDKESVKTAKKVLSELKGINAKKSKVDAKKNEISAKLSGKAKGKLTATEVVDALNDAGVKASLKKG